MALIGTGGIGKTSIILAVLDDHRIRQSFGENRSFIRCDRLTPSHTHFLQRLSEVTGAGVENPEDLTSLQRYLSSRKMIIVLDNAESILGLTESNAHEIHAIIDELSQFSNICLVITSRISNGLPTPCEIIEIPTLSTEAGRETFYRIHMLGERSDEINNILKELDFHPLSITLLATVSQQNRWNTKRLTAEWEKQRTGVLQARNLGSLSAAIELSLASPMFQELGPDAREVLEVIAFFPQGVSEDNVGGLFPTISDGPRMFDTFFNLSLTYHGNGFVTMLAPLRDYLRPADPMASPLLLAAREHYFRRLSVELCPSGPGFDESRWIKAEDVNVEHLLDVFASIDPDSEDIWDACYCFMDHLYWHKPRLVILGSKVEALPDTHPSKPRCLLFLSRLFAEVGNWEEQKRILIHSLGIWRERGDAYWAAEALIYLSDANRMSGFHEEGIQQAREAMELFGQLGETEQQAHCLIILASLLLGKGQLDAAEEAACRAISLSENRDEFGLCQSHRVRGAIDLSKGDTGKAVHHLEASLRIASLLGLCSPLFEGHLSLAYLYIKKGKLDDAYAHSEHAKSHAGDDMHRLARAFFVSACVLYAQNMSKEGRLEASRALVIFEKLGAADLAEEARQFLEETKEIIYTLHDNGKLLKWCTLPHIFTLLIGTQTPDPNPCGKNWPGFFDASSPDVDVTKPQNTFPTLYLPAMQPLSLVTFGDRYYSGFTFLSFPPPREYLYPPPIISHLLFHFPSSICHCFPFSCVVHGHLA